MSQDLLYSILPRPMSNQVTPAKDGIKKVDKTNKKGIVEEEQTTLTGEERTHTVEKQHEKQPTSKKDDDGLDTYA